MNNAPKITDWISSLAAVISVLVTLGIGIFITYYASGFRIRVKGWIDKNDVVGVRVVNWGRLAGEVSECSIVVRPTLAGRFIRMLARKSTSDYEEIGVVLREPEHLDSGTSKIRYYQLDLDAEYSLPVHRRPLRQFADRKAERRELRLAVQPGVSPRTKYRRLRGLSGQFPELPDVLPGSGQSRNRRAQAERALELVGSLTELQRDGLLSETELTVQRQSILRRLIDELRQQGLGLSEEITLTSDVVDLIDVLRLLGRSRRDGLLPDSEFADRKDQLLAPLHNPSSPAAQQDTEGTSH